MDFVSHNMDTFKKPLVFQKPSLHRTVRNLNMVPVILFPVLVILWETWCMYVAGGRVYNPVLSGAVFAVGVQAYFMINLVETAEMTKRSCQGFVNSMWLYASMCLFGASVTLLYQTLLSSTALGGDPWRPLCGTNLLLPVIDHIWLDTNTIDGLGKVVALGCLVLIMCGSVLIFTTCYLHEVRHRPEDVEQCLFERYEYYLDVEDAAHLFNWWMDIQGVAVIWMCFAIVLTHASHDFNYQLTLAVALNSANLAAAIFGILSYGAKLGPFLRRFVTPAKPSYVQNV